MHLYAFLLKIIYGVDDHKEDLKVQYYMRKLKFNINKISFGGKVNFHLCF